MEEAPDATVLHEGSPPQVPNPLSVLGEQLQRAQDGAAELYRSHGRGITSYEALSAASVDGFRLLRTFIEEQVERLRDPVACIQEMPMIRKFEDKPINATLPVVTVGAIMGTLYVSYACVYMPVMGVATSGLPSIVFHSCFGLALWSYHQGVVTDPGGIPDSWVHVPEDGMVFVEKKKKNGGGLRFCSKEHKYKPDRAHYCSALGRNILRMDHYCPWLGNCVGHGNQKHFVLFLFYTVLSVNLVDLSILRALFCVGGFSGGHTIMMAHGAFLSTLLASVLTPFFGFHCWLLANNMTTIEYCEKRGRNSAYVSPYDNGIARNLASVLGDSFLLWPLPIGSPPDDGLNWTAGEGLDPWMLSDDEDDMSGGDAGRAFGHSRAGLSIRGNGHDRETGRGLPIGRNGHRGPVSSSSSRSRPSGFPSRHEQCRLFTDLVPGAVAAMRECSSDVLEFGVAHYQTCHGASQALCDSAPVQNAIAFLGDQWTSIWRRT